MSGRWLFFFCLLLCLFCFVLFFFSFRMFLGKLVRYYCPSYYESCFGTCFRQQITVFKQEKLIRSWFNLCLLLLAGDRWALFSHCKTTRQNTNMERDSHNKTDLVRSITHHHSLSYNCIFRGLGWSYFLLAITQSSFLLNSQTSWADVVRLRFGPLTGPYSTLTFETLSFAVNP